MPHQITGEETRLLLRMVTLIPILVSSHWEKPGDRTTHPEETGQYRYASMLITDGGPCLAFDFNMDLVSI